jgi:hypothetical protein
LNYIAALTVISFLTVAPATELVRRIEPAITVVLCLTGFLFAFFVGCVRFGGFAGAESEHYNTNEQQPHAAFKVSTFFKLLHHR